MPGGRSTDDGRGREGGAFTLVELLVLIVIVSVLLSVLLPALAGAVRRSRELACLANIREANTVATAWANDHRDLPPHFALSETQTDSLGVPLIDIPHDGYTSSTNYFSQTWLWLRSLTSPGEPVERGLSCTGLDRSLTNEYVFTSYRLSAALLADPAVFTPETVNDFTPEMFRPQPLFTVAAPSSKALLAEQRVAHFGGESTPTLDLPACAAPVAFVDGHAIVAPFRDVEAIAIPADPGSPLPFAHTVRGVRGSDTP